MPNYAAPGVYIEEVPGARPITAVGTSTAAFVGITPNDSAHLNEVVGINNWSQFLKEFCTPMPQGGGVNYLAQAVYGYLNNGGRYAYIVNVGKDGALVGDATQRRGLDLLKEKDQVNIVVAPGMYDPSSHEFCVSHCESLLDRFTILDPPPSVKSIDQLTQVETAQGGTTKKGKGGSTDEGAAPAADTGPALPRPSSYRAFYYPWIWVNDCFDPKSIIQVPPAGHMAGIYARTDRTFGVHHAPANAIIRGAVGLTYNITQEEQELLNPKGVNCLRYFQTEGIRVWGARTGDPDAWKYISVRRLYIMVSQSIKIATSWAVFEPNDRTLWGHLIRDVTAFLMMIWRQGALMGRTPQQAFFVKCDEETNPQDEIDQGRLTIVVGFAPVKPAEFIIFRIGQSAERSEVMQGGGNG